MLYKYILQHHALKIVELCHHDSRNILMAMISNNAGLCLTYQLVGANKCSVVLQALRSACSQYSSYSPCLLWPVLSQKNQHPNQHRAQFLNLELPKTAEKAQDVHIFKYCFVSFSEEKIPPKQFLKNKFCIFFRQKLILNTTFWEQVWISLSWVNLC